MSICHYRSGYRPPSLSYSVFGNHGRSLCYATDGTPSTLYYRPRRTFRCHCPCYQPAGALRPSPLRWARASNWATAPRPTGLSRRYLPARISTFSCFRRCPKGPFVSWPHSKVSLIGTPRGPATSCTGLVRLRHAGSCHTCCSFRGRLCGGLHYYSSTLLLSSRSRLRSRRPRSGCTFTRRRGRSRRS